MAASCSDGEQSALWSSMPSALDDSCSDKMKGTSHRSPFGTMFVRSTDDRGAALLMSYLAGFPAKPTPAQLAEKTLQMISGRRCDGSWQMSLPGTYLPRTPSDARSTARQKNSRIWVMPSAQSVFPRQTWVRTTFGSGIGFLHTPTATANYACKSMQKWPNCREYVRVFGTPTPANHEWLMAMPTGWTDLRPLETHRFQSWLQQHSDCSLTDPA